MGKQPCGRLEGSGRLRCSCPAESCTSYQNLVMLLALLSQVVIRQWFHNVGHVFETETVAESVSSP